MQPKLGVRYSSHSGNKGPKPRITKMFTGSFYKKNFSVIPILVICVLDVAWVSFNCLYCFKKSDLIVTRKTKQHKDQTERLEHPVVKKFWRYEMSYPVNRELQKILDDMNCEEQKRKECAK